MSSVQCWDGRELLLNSFVLLVSTDFGFILTDFLKWYCTEDRSTADDTGAVCCIFRLLGPRDGRHQSPGGLTAPLSLPLSENWPFLCTMCYNGAGWSLLWHRTDTALQPGLGNVMKHTLETDHMDMWFRCEKGCIMHIHERNVFNNTTTQNFKTTF